MRFDVITLFPELFSAHRAHGVTRRAFESGQVEVHLWNLRDFGDPPHARVDDRPYGGGPGMVLLAQPLERALAAIREARAEAAPAPLVNFSPAGQLLRQDRVIEFATGAGAILLCARYEGVDQRFIDARVDLELSIGDYVLSGGDLPALVLLDAIARLQPGVLGDARSHQQDSFSAGLLDCPHYSRPERLDIGSSTVPVPDVLLSGHHAAIERWRRDRSLEATLARRPDLVERARAQGRLDAVDEATLATPQTRKL
jgi:tRNA (guanine37-N1)-methyltransferase